MKLNSIILFFLAVVLTCTHCTESKSHSRNKPAAEILSNPDVLAISYGGYRHATRDSVPSVDEIMEDLAILSAMDIKIVRTYNTQEFAHAARLLEAIDILKSRDAKFEMYVMLGAWIQCEGAWTSSVNHDGEDIVNNTKEIEAAVALANKYTDIVKVIAVGNEAMVKWATGYFVQPEVILKWVNHLNDLREAGDLPDDIRITSSDNFASWGGAQAGYHTEDLEALFKAVDYVSLHTYPFHDTHYNPKFWGVPGEEGNLTDTEKVEAAMIRAKDHAMAQYNSVVEYMSSLGVNKPVHIGETGWASVSNSLMGPNGSRAADEYKQKLYHDHIREWTRDEGITCFFFEAFDEKWKDAGNPLGSENHFGLFTVDGKAKYVLWEAVDAGKFSGLKRGGQPIMKSQNGNAPNVLKQVLAPPQLNDLGFIQNPKSQNVIKTGTPVHSPVYVVISPSAASGTSGSTYPSAGLKLNPWEGTCGMTLKAGGIIEVSTGTGDWWGGAIELQADGKGENLTGFKNGVMQFELKGDTRSTFEIGFQTGSYVGGSQKDHHVIFSPLTKYSIDQEWTTYLIDIDEMAEDNLLDDVTTLFYLRGVDNFDGKSLFIRNIAFKR